MDKRSTILDNKINSDKGQSYVFKIAKQMAKEKQDVVRVDCVRRKDT